MKQRILFLLALIIILLMSCSDNGAGIFYEIELERPIKDRNLSNSLTIGSLISTDTAYFAAAGKIYTKLHNSTEWSSLTSPGGSDDYSAGRIAYFDTYLVALCAEFYSGSVSVFLSADNGSTWGSSAIIPDIEGGVIDLLSAYDSTSATDRIFVITRYSDPDNSGLFLHSVYEITAIADTTTASATLVSAISGTRNQIIDITFDADGNIWAVTSAEAYTDAALGTGLPSGVYYTGVYYSQLFSTLFIAVYDLDDDESDVYSLTDTAWTAVSTDLGKRVYGFGDITVYNEGGTAISALTLGTASGYYEMLSLTEGFVSPVTTADNNYKNYSFSTATVFKLKRFSHDDSYDSFGLTSGEGLWINNELSWDKE